MAAFINHDGTITSIDGEGMTWVTGTPYSPRAQAIRDQELSRYHASKRAKRTAEKARKDAEKAKKDAEKAKKEAEKTNKANQTPNKPVNCCVLL